MEPQYLLDQRLSDPAPAPVIIWQDIFVLVDRGALHPAQYLELEQLGLELIARHSGGIAVLIVIPSVAKPPPDEVRTAIANILSRIAPSLRCVCWIVEGSGFFAAAARAALVGLQMVSRAAYPTEVFPSVDEALRWIMPQMINGRARMETIPDAAVAIERGRASIRPK